MLCCMCSFGTVCFISDKQKVTRSYSQKTSLPPLYLVDILITTLQNCHNNNGLDCNQELIKLSRNGITIFLLDWEKSLRVRFTKKMALHDCGLRFLLHLWLQSVCIQRLIY